MRPSYLALPGWQRPPLVGRLDIRWTIPWSSHPYYRRFYYKRPIDLKIAPIHHIAYTIDLLGVYVQCPICHLKLYLHPDRDLDQIIQCPRCALYMDLMK